MPHHEYLDCSDYTDWEQEAKWLRKALAERTRERNAARDALEKAMCVRIVSHGEPYRPLCGFMIRVEHVYYHQDDCEGQAALGKEADDDSKMDTS